MSKGNIFLIKDLSLQTGLSVYTIKYYLNLGLIQESSRTPETNFRLFGEETIEQLQQIRNWRRQRKSIKEIKQLIREMEGVSTG